jgi:hypothetical protein
MENMMAVWITVAEPVDAEITERGSLLQGLISAFTQNPTSHVYPEKSG